VDLSRETFSRRPLIGPATSITSKYGGYYNKALQSPPVFSTVQALVVDDSERNRWRLMRRLHRLGVAHLTQACNGLEAVQAVERRMRGAVGKDYGDNGSKMFDIIFMKWDKPVMDGIDATMKIRGLGFTGAIVIVTGDGYTENDVHKAAACGASRVLRKPVLINDVEICLRDVDRRHPIDQYSLVARESDSTSRQLKPIRIVRRDKLVYAAFIIDVMHWKSRSSVEYLLDTSGVLAHSASVTVSANAAAKVCEFCESRGLKKEITVTICCNYFSEHRALNDLCLTPTVFFEPVGVVFCGESEDACFDRDEFAGISVSLPSYVCAESHWDEDLNELNKHAIVLTTTPEFVCARNASPADIPFNISHWQVSLEGKTDDDSESPPPSGHQIFRKHEILRSIDKVGKNTLLMFRINLLHFTGELVVAITTSMFAAGMLTAVALTALSDYVPVWPWRIKWSVVFAILKEAAFDDQFQVHFWVTKSEDSLHDTIVDNCFVEVLDAKKVYSQILHSGSVRRF
jgi:CheY-like chemotaxis protein